MMSLQQVGGIEGLGTAPAPATTMQLVTPNPGISDIIS